MKCSKCGAELPEGSVFCFHCGARVEQSEEEVAQEPEAEDAGGGKPAQKPSEAESTENPVPETGSAENPSPGAGDAGSRTPDKSGTAEPESEKTESRPRESTPAEEPKAAEPEDGLNQGAQVPQDTPAGTGKKSGKMKFILPVAILAVAVVAIAVFMNMSNPKETVKRSLDKTIAAISEEETGLSSYLGLPGILENIKTGETHQELTASVELNELGIDIDGDVGLSAVVDRDAEAGTSGNVAVTLFGMDGQLAEFYGDADQWLVAAPLLFDESLYVDRAQMKEMTESGEIFDRLESELGMEMDDLTKDAIRLLAGVEREDGQSLISLNLIEEYMEYSAQVRETLIEHSEVEKADGKSFEIGGSSTECDGYLITIPEEDAKALIANFGDFLKLKIVPLLDEIDRALDNGESDYESDIDAILGGVGNLCTGGLELTAYVGPQNRLVSVGAHRDFSADGEAVSIQLTLNLLGEKDPADDMGLSFEMSGTEVWIAAGLDRTLTETDTDISSKLAMRLEDNEGNDVGVSGEYTLNKGSGDCSAKLTIDSQPEVVAIGLSGTLDDVKPGKSFTLAFDTLELTADGETYAVDVEAKYAIGGSGRVDSESIMARDRLNVLEADESDWDALSEELLGNLAGLEYQLGLDGMDYGYGDDPYGYGDEPYGYEEEPYGYEDEPYGYEEEPYGYEEEPYDFGEDPYTEDTIYVLEISLDDLMNLSEDTIVAYYGPPDRYSEGSYALYGDEFAEYLEFSFDSSGYLESVSGSPEYFFYGDQNLYEDYDVITTILGVEEQSLGGAGQMFQSEWDVGDYALIFTFPIFADENGLFLPMDLMITRR